MGEYGHCTRCGDILVGHSESSSLLDIQRDDNTSVKPEAILKLC